MENKMNTIKRTERGWPGHYCLGHRCCFHLNTLLEFNNIFIVVSTVGRLLNDKCEEEPISTNNRYYETMVFEAKYDNTYYDADSTKQINTNNNWLINEISHNSDLKANEMHEKIVEEISNKLIKGKIK